MRSRRPGSRQLAVLRAVRDIGTPFPRGIEYVERTWRNTVAFRLLARGWLELRPHDNPLVVAGTLPQWKVTPSGPAALPEELGEPMAWHVAGVRLRSLADVPLAADRDLVSWWYGDLRGVVRRLEDAGLVDLDSESMSPFTPLGEQVMRRAGIVVEVLPDWSVSTRRVGADSRSEDLDV